MQTVLERLTGVRPSGAGWVARCPGHDDRHASLSVSVGTDRRALLHCHAGCPQDQVIAALRLAPADLFLPSADAPSRPRSRREPSTSARYQIRDAAGAVVAIHVRTPDGDGKRFTWRQPDGSLGLAGTKTADLPLYGSESSTHWDRSRPVVLAEGEKATDALSVAGLQAVGTVTGAASTPAPASLELLRGHHVVLWPDADERGVEHMERVADALLPLVRSLRRVSWPEAPEHGDAADTDPETIARLVESAEWLTAELPIPRSLAEITAPADLDTWLVTDFIRPGTTVMLAGPPGVAKSWASRQLAMCAAGGLPFFLTDRYRITRPMRVLVVDEDNGDREEYLREERIREHLHLGREQLEHVYRVSLTTIELAQERWQGWLRSLIDDLSIDLVILDPISEMYAGKELREEPEFRAVRLFLKRLKIERRGVSTVLVHHTRKGMREDRAATRQLEDVRGQWGQTPDVVAIMSPIGDRRARWELHKRVPHSVLLLEQLTSGVLQVVVDESDAAGMVTVDDRILDAIDAGWTSSVQLLTATGLAKSSFYKAISRLNQAGLITRREPFHRLEDPTDDPLDGPTESGS